MKPHSRATDDARCLNALRGYRLLETQSEPALDDLTQLAADICHTPISLIWLVAGDRQWFTSTVGIGVDDAPLDASFCGHAIQQRDLFVVPDAAASADFADSPMVTGEPYIRFYAGAPLVTPQGQALGTLCVMDRVPRQLTSQQAQAMRVLAQQVIAQFELRRPRRELVESDAPWLQVFHDGPTALAIHRFEDRTFVDVNAAFTRLFGWRLDEVVGRDSTELGMLEAAAMGPLRELLTARGEFHEQEVVLRTRDGDVRVALISSQLVELPDRRHSLTTYVDITLRKRAEAELRRREETLRQNEARYRALFECAPDGILIADRDSCYRDVNASMCAMLGRSRDELIGLHATDIVAPQQIAEIGKALDAIKAGAEHQREWHFRHSDGSVFAADVIATKLPDGHILAMVRDATERNRAIDALRAAEERVRFALESANVGIWDMDFTAGTLRWSDLIEKQYGFDCGAFTGTFDAFMARVFPDDRAGLLATIEGANVSGADFTTAHRALWPDGTVRWLNGAGRIQLDGEGRPVRGIGISIDVTERHRLEQQYQQAQKMEAVGRLAGGIAHDFNNLLTAILGYCELLLVGLPGDDPRRDDIEEIHKASLRAASLTRQLLAFSRKQIIEPAVLDLNSLIGNMRSLLGRLIGEPVSIDLRLAAGLARIKADRGQLEQIVLNLAVNARDAMPEGGTLTIETANVESGEPLSGPPLVPAGRHVLLAIRDTGAGMSDDVQARLFEPFFTTKDVGKGTGLGLATVHGIVAQSGGSITVDSEIGRGTCFRIYLPQTTEGFEVAHAPADSPVAADRRCIVLVVEDAEALRHLTKRLLERIGHYVLVAADGEEARRMFEQHPAIDVLLTDVIMPGESGPSLARHLLTRRPTLAVVYMSGYTEEAIVHHGVLDPGIAFIHKPLYETLRRKIGEAVSREGR